MNGLLFELMGILDKLQREHLGLYTFLKNIYSNTVGFWYFKELYVKYIGFYNGKKRLKLLGENEGNRILAEKIKVGKPFMMGRFGSSEVRGIFKDEFDILCFHAGFFPRDRRLLGKFKKVYLDAAKSLDVLAIWNYKNHFINKVKLMRTLPNIENIIPLSVAGGFGETWLGELKGKKILVINAFKTTIESQYGKRADLGILPELGGFEVVKAVQTLGNNKDKRFRTWFDALDFMKKDIESKDFDIALIACGAYGLPLASHVKSIGKQALLVGGGLQLLFGIKGKRWDNLGIYDENWVSMMKEDCLEDSGKFEGGCYW